ALTDRLQWRHPRYFHLLGEVMRTVRYDLDGQLVTAYVTEAMRAEAGAELDDSEDFVGLIRSAEGIKVAALLKERAGSVKVSVRARDGASAQRICLELGGGGHVAAAGATVEGDLEAARAALTAATARELARLREAAVAAPAGCAASPRPDPAAPARRPPPAPRPRPPAPAGAPRRPPPRSPRPPGTAAPPRWAGCRPARRPRTGSRPR